MLYEVNDDTDFARVLTMRDVGTGDIIRQILMQMTHLTAGPDLFFSCATRIYKGQTIRALYQVPGEEFPTKVSYTVRS